VLERLYPRAVPTAPTVEEILGATAEQFGLGPAALTAHDRRRAHVWARQVAMYLARELTTESLPAIGRRIGGREHSTVLSAHRRVKRAVETREEGAQDVLALRARLDRAASRP
jgi:chromosomal replication initiator protein